MPDPALLDAARALVPALAPRAALTETARSVSPETIADFHRTGILRVLQPRRYGGRQGTFETFSRIVETLAEGCAASAWVYAVLGEHQWIIGCLPERGQDDIWGDTPLAVASSSLAPREIAVAIDDGWRVSGSFPFSSGCQHAQWAIIGARAEDAAGHQPVRYLLVPMSEIEIVDDWQVLGLRGTGSRTLRLRDVFVPAHRTVLFSDLMAGTPPGTAAHPDYALLRAPRGFLVPFSLPTVAFALANRALALVPVLLRARPSRTGAPVAQSEVVQMRLGEAAAAIELATLIMHTRRSAATAAIAAGTPVTEADTLRNRRDIAFAVDQLRRGVDALMEVSGAHMVYDNNPLQPILRDLLTITTHTVVQRQGAMVPWGRLMAGLPVAP